MADIGYGRFLGPRHDRAQPGVGESRGPTSWKINRYHVLAELGKDGVADVKLTIDFDFASDPGHGPILVLPTRQRVNDPDKWLNLTVEPGEVGLPTGADTRVETRRTSDGVELKIGEEGRTFTGIQTYVITYRLGGLVSQSNANSGLDEFNWNAIGPLWEMPIQQMKAELIAPADIDATACLTGADTRTPCGAQHLGQNASFWSTEVGKKNAVQIVAGFPAGTFVGTTQTFSTRHHLGTFFALTPLTGTVTALLSIGGCVLLRYRVRKRYSDQIYLGLIPGLTPNAGQQAKVGTVGKMPPVAVQFSPPEEAKPAELGTLLDATADNVDFTALIPDRAVRGHLVIAPEGDDHRLLRTGAGEDGLARYERTLLRRIFLDQGQIMLANFKDPAYAKLRTMTQTDLYQQVVELGWFAENPSETRRSVAVAGVGIFGCGMLAGRIGAFFGWGMIGLAGVIAGILLIWLSSRITNRRAEGSAVLAQTRGVERYLATAEADQLRFEGQDIFSRYLPYAVVFGVVYRWVTLFKQLERSGTYFADTRWYGGSDFKMFDAVMFTAVLSGFSNSASRSFDTAGVSAATSGSSGGSGFSGGGGFGGGDGGGW